MSDCGKYLFLSISNSCRTNLFFYVDLERTGDIRGKLDIVRIVEKFEADYEVWMQLNSYVEHFTFLIYIQNQIFSYS